MYDITVNSHYNTTYLIGLSSQLSGRTEYQSYGPFLAFQWHVHLLLQSEHDHRQGEGQGLACEKVVVIGVRGGEVVGGVM